MKCKKCGTENSEAVEFGAKCGTQVTARTTKDAVADQQLYCRCDRCEKFLKYIWGELQGQV